MRELHFQNRILTWQMVFKSTAASGLRMAAMGESGSSYPSPFNRYDVPQSDIRHHLFLTFAESLSSKGWRNNSKIDNT
jgi:hypothetical protein